METSTAGAEGSNEDVTGKKKSRLKVLRARLFGRMKRKETGGLMKQSQSVSDVTAGESEEAGGDSGDEFLCSQSTLVSRAMSHDSVFLADEAQAPAEPVRVLSQENVPGKVKALQMKLQQQNMRLGPPPLLIPGKRAEDTGLSSEDDGLPHSPPETSLSLSEGIPKFPVTHRNLSSLSLVGTGSEEEEQGCSQSPSRPLSPGTKPDPTTTPAAPPGVDFDSPAQFKPCLDNSAARHRMSIKPRNQRASAKGRRLPSDVSRPRSESLNALDCPVPERGEEEDVEVPKDVVRFRFYSTQVIRSGQGGALRDPMVGKPSLPGEDFRVGHTDAQRRDSGTLEGHVTMNPLFDRPMPQGLEAPWMPDLGTGAAPQNSAELQKALETKRPSVGQPLGGRDSSRESLTDPGQCDTPNVTLAPSVTPGAAGPLPVLENNQTRTPKRSVQDVAQEPVLPKTQPLPSPPSPGALPSPAPTMSSLKRNTTAQAQQDSLWPEPSPSITAPPADSDDQPPPEDTNLGKQQRPSSGSFRFSVASAWDRPRAASLPEKEEVRGVKSVSDSQEVLESKPEEAKPRPQPLDPMSVGGLSARASFFSRREEQTAAAAEEAKPREQSRNVALFQERTNPNAKGKESAAPRDQRSKQVTMEMVVIGTDVGKDLRETRSGGAEEESEGEKEERTAFGVRLRSTSHSKYRRREVPNPEPKSQSLSVESCPLSQSRYPQGGSLGQSPDPHGGPLGQSRNPLGQSRGPLSQSCDPQTLTPTKRPDPLQQHSVAPQGSQSQRQEMEDRGTVPEHPCLKPSLHRKRTSSHSDPPASPADPRSTPSSATQCDHRDPRQGDVVDLPTDPSLDTGPAPKPASAPHKEAEPVLSEPVVSVPAWMTLARERTRSQQQLFTSKLPRDFTVTTPTTTPTPKHTPQSAPQPPQPCPAPQPTPQHPPLAVPPGRGDRAPHRTAERTATPQTRTDMVAQTEKKKNEKMQSAESTAPPADKRPERTEQSFSVGGKREPKPDSAEIHSTTSTAPNRLSTAPHIASTVPRTTSTTSHRAENKMEGGLACKVQTSEAASSSSLQSRDREDRQPIRTEASAAVSAVPSRGQPSWMELAKRKSLAWSDKAME